LAEVSFGEWLRRRRKALGLTQEQLAQQINCSTSALRKLEAEERRPSEQMAKQLAEVFSIAPSERASFLKFARGTWEAAPAGIMKDTSWHIPNPSEHKDQLNPKTHLATFLFTDIEDSTKLWESAPEQMKVALQRHHAVLQEAIPSNGGSVFQIIGDAFCAVFPTAPSAIAAAVTAQHGLHQEQWDLPFPIRVRMGIHTGEAERTSNGSSTGGFASNQTLNRVARILDAANGGQVLLSLVTKELLEDSLPANTNLRDMGEHHLKDLARPEHLFQLNIAGLPWDFPPLNTLDLHRHNLPVQLTSFIGREKEIVELIHLLEKARMVTLVGPGGTGKTRLALQIGAELLEHFQNGVWLVDLAPVTDATLIIQTAIAVSGITAERDRPIMDTLKDYLRAKSLLLILDNCEHLLDACAHFAESVLQSAPNVKVLATSRQALGIRGEQVYSVPSLSTPNIKELTTSEELTKFESVRLFVERATLVSPNFKLTKDNASSTAQICSRLDGNPLAIELAVARIRSMPVEQIASHIDDRFRLLTGGSRTALPRQQTLRSLMEWSYDLLTESERILLRRLAVFLGGWTLESAEAVCAGEPIVSFAVMDLLSKLVDKSLVLIDNSGRYKFLETIRQYAREKLLESGEMQAIRQRHLTYFLTFAETNGRETLGSNQIAALKQLDEEYENIRDAMDWAIETGQVEEATQIATALAWLYWQSHALFQEAYQKMMLILNHPKTTKENLFRATALIIAVFHGSFIMGDSKQGQVMIDEAIEISKLAGEKGKNQLAWAHAIWGLCMIGKDNLAAEQALDTGLSMAREMNDKFLLANTMEFQGSLAGIQKDYVRAQEFSNECIKLFREMGNHWGSARALGNIGFVLYLQGDFQGAQKYLEEALAIHRNIADKNNLITVLGILGQISALTANYAQAEELLEENLFFAKDSGWIQEIGTCTRDLAYLDLYQGNPAAALALFRESLSLFENWDKVGISLSLAGIASALFQLSPQNAKYAAQLLGSAQLAIDSIGIDNLPYEKERITKTLKTVPAYLGEADYQKLESQGKAMTLEVAIALAQKAVYA
jgi:predicted ATPase/class 3 adenylate cyclase/DNA-binding XRE family transcriptional regulator